jgi:hypothetical protein
VRKYADLYLDYLCVNYSRTADSSVRIDSSRVSQTLEPTQLVNFSQFGSFSILVFWGMMNAEVRKRLKYKG